MSNRPKVRVATDEPTGTEDYEQVPDKELTVGDEETELSTPVRRNRRGSDATFDWTVTGSVHELTTAERRSTESFRRRILH